MKHLLCVLTLILSTTAAAQNAPTFKPEKNMDRTDLCKINYTALFGGEALTGEGTDPEMMDILQKFIFGEVFDTGGLDIKTREMITCATLAALQTFPQLKAHAGAALNIGITPVELREVIYLTAPLTGFPKMLNALNTVNDVFRERNIALPLEKQGTADESNRHEKGKAIQNSLYEGGIADVMKGLPGSMGADVECFLTDYCFGEIYSRKGLDLKTRELLVYCMLAALEAESQLRSHFHGNLKAGNSPETLTAAIIQCLPYTGFPSAIKALNIIKEESYKTVHTTENLVRLSKITVDPAHLDAYNAYLKEEIETSMRLEPGVLTLYATCEKKQPNQITILEIYAGKAAYESHIRTPHFQKYKQGTLTMVQDLQLIDSTPLIPGLKIKPF